LPIGLGISEDDAFGLDLGPMYLRLYLYEDDDLLLCPESIVRAVIERGWLRKPTEYEKLLEALININRDLRLNTGGVCS
jgi:hypothetical protein